MDSRYIWVQLENNLPQLEADKSSFLSLLNSLESQLSRITVELDVLSSESQKVKHAHREAESEFQATQERYEYVKCIQILDQDVLNYKTQVETLDVNRAATKLKDMLTSLKLNLLHVFNTAKDHTSLVSPINSSDSYISSGYLAKSPSSRVLDSKTRSQISHPTHLGMRLLLPAETLKDIVILLDMISKHCLNMGHSWLMNVDNLEMIASTSSRVAFNFKQQLQSLAYDLRSNRHSTQSEDDDRKGPVELLEPVLRSMELQFAQHIFWLCRTCQELKILVAGPPSSPPGILRSSMSQHSTYSAINSPNNRFASPSKSQASSTSSASSASWHSSPLFLPQLSTTSKSFSTYLNSLGIASVLFDTYTKQFDKIVESRLKQLSLPDPEHLESFDDFLQQLYDVVARIWISNKLLWNDTPELTKSIAEFEDLDLGAYLDLHFFDDFVAAAPKTLSFIEAQQQVEMEDAPLPRVNSYNHMSYMNNVAGEAGTTWEMSPVAYIEKPVYPPGLSLYCQPSIIIEECNLKWISMIDAAAVPAYERLAKSTVSLQLDTPMSLLSQLVMFWGNTGSGPWYGFIQNGVDPLIVAMQYVPRIQCLRRTTHVCLHAMKKSSAEERQTFIDRHIWSSPAQSATRWKRLLVECLIMLLCHPGQLQVEDFLVQSLVPSASMEIHKDDAMAAYRSFLTALTVSPADSDSAETQSLWSREVVDGILKSIKLGSILVVLKIKIQEQIDLRTKVTF